MNTTSLAGGDEGLITHQVDSNVSKLTTLFPAIRQTQLQIAEQDIQSLAPASNPEDEAFFKQLRTASQKADPAMEAAIERKVEQTPKMRHLFEENTWTENARVFNGDIHGKSAGDVPRAQGPGHHFHKNEAKGNAKVFNGDYTGDGSEMKDFWA